jgi:hypothetical protein
MRKTQLHIKPAPDRVLIRITRAQIDNITSKEIVRDDGKKVRLFREPKFDKGFDRAFMQNVSVGEVVAVGSRVRTEIFRGDIAILDYLVTNDVDSFVGYFNNDQLVCIHAESTYHEEDALPSQTGRRAWVKGDHDIVSKLLGVIRGDQMIAFDPYVFLEYKPAVIVMGLKNGKVVELPQPIETRTVIAAPEDSFIESGDEVLVKEADIFPRHVNDKEFWVVFQEDIMMVKKSDVIEIK